MFPLENQDSSGNEFEDIYSKPNQAPWSYEAIPPELQQVAESDLIPPCGKILEIGCGEGHNAIFFAKKGFDVTAIDASKNAIRFAQQNATKKRVAVDFRNEGYDQIQGYDDQFDFIYDWRFLHEITDEQERARYIEAVHNLLKERRKYLSVAFSGDSDFMGTGEVRKSPVGIEIYFAKLAQFREFIKKRFNILDSKLITVPQKPNLQIESNYVLAEKKS